MNPGAWDEPRTFPKSRSQPPATLEINGRRIFAKGSNWVPPDMLYGRLDRAVYARQLGLAKDAHFNLLRVWGGGIVNKEPFFELCDELGLMVWQEFPLACNNYPDEPRYLAVLEAESRAIVRRVRRHPCLALWCGGNELFNTWSRMTDQSKALRLLNRTCLDLDPETPFLATSPLFGMGHGDYRFRDGEGREVFQIFALASASAYCEFGCPGPASAETLKSIIPAGELFPPRRGTAWEAHNAFGAWSPEPESWLCADDRALLRPQRHVGGTGGPRPVAPGRRLQMPVRRGPPPEAPRRNGLELVLQRALALRREQQPDRLAVPSQAGLRNGEGRLPPHPGQCPRAQVRLVAGRTVRLPIVLAQRLAGPASGGTDRGRALRRRSPDPPGCLGTCGGGGQRELGRPGPLLCVSDLPAPTFALELPRPLASRMGLVLHLLPIANHLMSQTDSRLAVTEKICYGVGDMASCLFWNSFSMFLLYFYTDVFGLAAVTAGTMIFLIHTTNSVIDPGMGLIADRTQTRWGKFRPWLLWMAVPFGVIGVLQYTTPDLSLSGKIVYAYITHLLMCLVYSAINVPFSALMGVITPSSIERTSLSSYRFVFAFGSGIIVAGTTVPLVEYFGGANRGVVSASLAGNTLRLDEAGTGNVKLIVTADDGHGGVTRNTAFVKVLPPDRLPPAVARKLDDLSLAQGFSSRRIPLTGMFDARDGQSLRYRATSSADSVVKAEPVVNGSGGNELILTEAGPGTARVTVSAVNATGAKADAEITVHVNVPGNRPPVAADDISEAGPEVGFRAVRAGPRPLVPRSRRRSAELLRLRRQRGRAHRRCD